ncbi:GntP family gluconate:H+ symporter [Arcicella aurantiaca]|uniref:GntP family gluconate:H+ symporter n=1 Tax=Arcicella aurantiaca TaxID=591202 RepID=A0A316E940_9BACT|nr:GntP family permease [Arcicella aurantiaca]PWK25253.1 GntP family gluconate:H+ symporter [Arcicella aurantiaca]
MLSPLFVSILLVISILLIILLSSKYKFNTFFVLLIVSILVGLIANFSGEDVIKSLKTGFGHTLEKIGLLIILGTTLGVILDRTKATLSIANYILQKTGEKSAGLAITLIGFIIGLPIFCDSGFIVLSGLLHSLSKKVRNSHVFFTVCLAGALYAVHCLVPPHPGITAAAGQLNVELGQTMLLGTLLAIPSTVVVYFWAKFAGKKYNNLYEEQIETTDSIDYQLFEGSLPNPLHAFLPILFPIFLISLKSLVLLNATIFPEKMVSIIKFLGEPITALFIGILLALSLFKTFQKSEINHLLESAIEKSGPILAIIAVGGVFGEIIKMLDLGKVYGEIISELHLGIFIPFILTAIFKTAQGSSTVAIISSASIILPLLPSLGLDSEWGKQITLMAMGAGSMMVSHANDAYFWVVSRFANIGTELTLKSYTIMTILMGLATFISICILHYFHG